MNVFLIILSGFGQHLDQRAPPLIVADMKLSDACQPYPGRRCPAHSFAAVGDQRSPNRVFFQLTIFPQYSEGNEVFEIEAEAGHADRRTARTQADDIRRSCGHDRSCPHPLWQRDTAWETSNRRRPTSIEARHVSGSSGCSVSQSRPEICRAGPQNAKPQKLVIVAIARRLIVIANAILKTDAPWQISAASIDTVAKAISRIGTL